MILIVLSFPVSAKTSNFNLELRDANLPDAIHALATFLDQNIVMSKTVHGRVTLHLRHADARDALALLLAAQNLGKWQMGNIWFIAPKDELIKRKQDDIKWQELSEESQPLKTMLWPIRFGEAEIIAHFLQDEKLSLLSKRGFVRVDKRTNTLCVKETEEHLKSLHQVIQKIDVPTQQVVIEARLASVDSDIERELGVDFSLSNELSGEAPQPGRFSIAVAHLPDGSHIDVKLAALEREGRAELISSPSLFTANHQPASIEAGEEVPYQEVSESGGTAVVFKKAVLGLKVTPQVLPGNKVLLELKISQDRPSNQMVQGMPVIRTRQINTQVLVKNGKTIVLGGIYETNREENVRRLPFISDLPVLSWLFKEQKKSQNKRELLIFCYTKSDTNR